jgi:hypothetical protein
MNDTVSLFLVPVLSMTRVAFHTYDEVFVPGSSRLPIFESIVDAEWEVADVTDYPEQAIVKP